GTIEFRICDAPTNLACLLGLAVLTRCLVIDGLKHLAEQPELVAGDRTAFTLTVENRWRAARYGLEALCTLRAGERPIRLADDSGSLLGRLGGVAGMSGDGEFLTALQPSSGFESGADRQRRLYRETGDWQAVIADRKSAWVLELER